MKKLNEKIAVITGGNSGIGLAAAKAFHNEGAKVIVTASSQASYEKAKSEFGSTFDVVHTDVRKVHDVDALANSVKDKYGRIDVLFANAGVAHFAPSEHVTESFYDDHFTTNVRGLFFTVAHMMPLLSQGASVILTSSALHTKGIAGGAVYSATKAAIRSFARSWTAELAPKGVRVNVLSPGAIQTPIYAKMGMPEAQLKGFAQSIESQTPAGRFGTAEEMAKVALFLASSDSSYIFGADISADGGFAQI